VFRKTKATTIGISAGGWRSEMLRSALSQSPPPRITSPEKTNEACDSRFGELKRNCVAHHHDCFSFISMEPGSVNAIS
jgi:hypothetical protein